MVLKQDPHSYRLDEGVGAVISVLGVPIEVTPVALATFALLDWLKPWPLCWLDDKEAKWAVFADDVVAGVVANATAWIVKLIL